MKILEKLVKKKKRLIVGLMSGTSADGVDAVLVELTGSGTSSAVRQIAFQTYPYPSGFKDFLLKNSDPRTARLDDIARLDMLVAMFFADAAQQVVRKARRRMRDIDLIGSHGQTIQHVPTVKAMFGKKVRGTLQIGNASAISKMTGVVTVGDFRIGDIAVGGSGAPLVPLFDFLMVRSRRNNRIALNIGGIANMTVLPKNCAIDDVVAFDSGPGNMLIDQLMQKLFRKPFDAGGEVALRGKLLPRLLYWMAQHPYLRVKPPKSTGREMFGKALTLEILRRAGNAKACDIIATVTEFTALSIYRSYVQFIRKTMKIGELFVSGGGVHNLTIMEALRRYFAITIRLSDEAAISADAKEAICFALLANETIAGNPGNVPGATGAKRRTVLGAICVP